MSSTCPRCQQSLVENQVDEIAVRLCPPCEGILLAQTDLVRILDRSWRAVRAEAAEKLEFRATEALQTEPVYHCPDCGQPMEKYRYMGLAAIPIDRCDRCDLMWLDANELQNMVLALAKTNYRSERAFQRDQAERIDITRGSVPPVGPAGEIWLIRECKGGPEQMAVAALQLLRLLLR